MMVVLLVRFPGSTLEMAFFQPLRAGRSGSEWELASKSLVVVLVGVEVVDNVIRVMKGNARGGVVVVYP